jgi:outer membrane protein
MIGPIRIWATAFLAVLAITQVRAADLTPTLNQEPPPAPPGFYVHAGALGGFPQTNAQPTGGGFFNAIPSPFGVATVSNVAIRPAYTLALEAGYFVTPNIAIAVSASLPPLEHFKATGFPQAGLVGTNLLGSTRAGLAMLLLQYHFTQFGAFQPYAGVGAGYLVDLGNISDGILTNFSLDQNFAFVLQAGADLMLTPNWGVFVDGKKEVLSTDAQGFVLDTNVPIRAHVTLDPWRASAGITFKY